MVLSISLQQQLPLSQKIAVCMVTEDKVNSLQKNKHYVLHGAKSWPSDDSVYVRILNETKVISVLLRSVVHCVLSEMHNVYNDCYCVLYCAFL